MTKKIYTYYDKLSVPRNATDDQIIDAYSELFEKYNPNKLDGDKKQQAEKILAAITAAYENLLDPVKRTQHDDWIDQQDKNFLSDFSKFGNVGDKISEAGSNLKNKMKSASENIDIDSISAELKNVKNTGVKRSSNLLNLISEGYLKYFIGAVKKYAEFTGRATRMEYWMFYLFYVVNSAVLGGVAGILGAKNGAIVVSLIYFMAMLIPSIAIHVRRMHDIGKSGWFVLVPVYNFIALFISSQDCKNRFDSDYVPEKNSNHLFDELQKLNELKLKGILTEDEFMLKKQEIMSRL